MSKKLKFNKRKLDFNKICRACLQERSQLRDLFSTRLPSIIVKLCPSIQVSEEDDLPDKICASCFNQLTRFFSFKKKVEQNNRVLQQYAKEKKGYSKEFSDILDKAVTEAEIKRNNRVEIGTDDVGSIEFVDGNIVNADNITIKHESVLLDEPPPLVPLEPSSCLSNTNLRVVPKFAENAPPLVPIKPLASINPAVIVNALSDNFENPVGLQLQCNVCNEEFKSVYALKKHRMYQCQLNSMQCNICKKQINDRNRLIGHLKGHIISKDYCCKVCGKRYPNPSTFRVHMRIHTGERPFKCQICNKGFIRWAGVVGHMRTHDTNKPYKCPTCNKGFKISSNLERHKILHSGILPFCCSYCGKTFSQADNLQLHVRTYHTNERPYLCSDCGKSFVSSTRLKRHIWIHTGYKPYKCQHCSKSYSNSNDRNNHERSHVDFANQSHKPYVCNKCHMRFLHPCRLTKHLKTHERPFACPGCFKTFISQSLLSKHLVSRHNVMFLHDVSDRLSVEDVYKLSHVI